MTIRLALAATLLAFTALTPASAPAQEGPAPTQTLVVIHSKNPINPQATDLALKIDGHDTPVASLTRVGSSGLQVAILIDDGLRETVARQLPSLRDFILHLTPGTEIFVGYMQNGRVVAVQPFTTAYESAAQSLRLPMGGPGMSASPYFCLTDFIKHWPASAGARNTAQQLAAGKARVVLMITSGVDPYNGSDRIMNQDSPYVADAVTVAQRAGVVVSSIYSTGAGLRSGAANMSGQSYLGQVAEGTGGSSYYVGMGSPVDMAPYLQEFQRDLSETYVAAFDTPVRKDLVRVKLSTKLPGTKVRAPEYVLPGGAAAAAE